MSAQPKSLAAATGPTGPVGAREAELRGERSPLRRFLKLLGPGLITGASDDDPSGIGTYASTGAALGYAPLWLALVTFPLMAAVQFVCARIGLVTGRGLAGVLRQHYSRWLLYPVVLALLVANTINAGVDLGAIAVGLNLLAPSVPFAVFVVSATVVVLALQVWGSYRLLARIFKYLTLALFAYIGSAFFARPDLRQVLYGTFIPVLHLDGPFLMALVAILGTTISPYLFFWQASQEVEEKVAMGRKKLWQRQGTSDPELRYAAWDVGTGMFFSNVVMYFIILATAATLWSPGHPAEIETAAQAAEALRPLAGNAAFLLLTLGLVGSGFLAVPVLTTASAYAVCESFGWKLGLDRSLLRARAFYALIIASTLLGMGINFVGLNPMKALYWTAVLNGLLAPPLLVLILVIANNRAIMDRRTNGWATNLLVGATTLFMFAAAVGLLLFS